MNGDGTVSCQAVVGVGGSWSLSGNARTTAGTNFLGTTDNQALELKVNGQRVLRLEPNALNGSNVIGGSPANTATGDGGAFIGGGGQPAGPNTVTGTQGTVAGGAGNTAGFRAVVAGGESNTASGQSSTVGGGLHNTADGFAATVSGGQGNEAGDQAAVAGGEDNQALGLNSFVGGGQHNDTQGFEAVVLGGQSNSATGAKALRPVFAPRQTISTPSSGPTA